MDEQLRQAEREGDLVRAGRLACRSGRHWWSCWADANVSHTPRWTSREILHLFGLQDEVCGIKQNQVSVDQKFRECFWCGKLQRMIYIRRWTGNLSAEKLVEFIHER